MIDIDDVVAVESSPTSSKNSTTRAKRSINGITLPISSKMENSSSAKTAITRDELLSLYILKLDEEANYFKVSPTSLLGKFNSVLLAFNPIHSDS